MVAENRLQPGRVPLLEAGYRGQVPQEAEAVWRFFGVEVCSRAVLEVATPRARRLCRVLGARAVTLGRVVYFRDPLPLDAKGQAFLVHELTHVVQWGTRWWQRVGFLLRYLVGLLPFAFRGLVGWLRGQPCNGETGWGRFLCLMHEEAYRCPGGHWAECQAVEQERAFLKWLDGRTRGGWEAATHPHP